MTEGAGASIPARVLCGAEESAYVRRLRETLAAARLGSHYPDGTKLSSHLGVLAPEVHRGLYPGLEVDLRSGLPTYREWTRAQTDVKVAADQLRQLGARAELERKAGGKRGAIHEKQLAKHDYYAAIAEAQLSPLGEMSVALRRSDPETKRAEFHVVLDKLDASGLFVRYSLDFAQTSEAWARPVVLLQADDARHTEGFRSLIYQFTSYDAEFTFLRLATMGGLAVERVVKGVVGPLCLPWTKGEAPVRDILGADGFVAMFALDMAAVDVPADRDNDPFADLLREKLSPEARAEYDASRQRYGYKVFKDRKFVAPRGVVAGLKGLCEGRGGRNVIYGV
ncbi:MAG: hypothetical protein HY907_06865 [Deltaproteobacteria bacterium]|nr:hypothetical protein [Deltaproteobacteria bacterium]